MEFEKTNRNVKSKDLLHVYNKYTTLLKLCINAKERAISDKTDRFIINIGIVDIIGRPKKNRKNIIKEYFDKIQKDIEENTILNLVATFEKIIFIKIPPTINHSKQILSSNYNDQYPFSSSIKSFVKESSDINNISAIQTILTGSISVTLERKLKEIIAQRNRIAHGKRFGRESDLTVNETLEKLDEIIEIVS